MQRDVSLVEGDRSTPTFLSVIEANIPFALHFPSCTRMSWGTIRIRTSLRRLSGSLVIEAVLYTAGVMLVQRGSVIFLLAMVSLKFSLRGKGTHADSRT